MGVVLSQISQNAQFTGWLLKFVDQARGLRHEVKRPKSLNDLWGPETTKPIAPQAVDQTTAYWLKKSGKPNLEQLANQLPTEPLKTIGRHIRTATMINQGQYRDLIQFNLLEKKFGQGNSPAQELAHEVNNVINRLRLLHPEKIYPAQEVVTGLSAQDQLKLYATMAGELLQAYQDPSILDKPYTRYGKTTTGRQIFLSALRHASQHGGTLAAFFETMTLPTNQFPSFLQPEI